MFSISILAGQVQVKVGGMSCISCKMSIEKNFKKNAKVQDCNVDLATQTMTLALKDGQEMSQSEINALLKQAGETYTALEIKR